MQHCQVLADTNWPVIVGAKFQKRAQSCWRIAQLVEWLSLMQVFKTKTSHLSCRNSLPLSFCLKHRRKKWSPLCFFPLLFIVVLLWLRRRVQKDSSALLWKQHFVQGGCLLSVSSGAWQRWLSVYISVRCDGASWLKWRQIPQRDWLTERAHLLWKTHGDGRNGNVPGPATPRMCAQQSVKTTRPSNLKNASTWCEDWGMMTNIQHDYFCQEGALFLPEV